MKEDEMNEYASRPFPTGITWDDTAVLSDFDREHPGFTNTITWRSGPLPRARTRAKTQGRGVAFVTAGWRFVRRLVGA